jgi:hypothetical protein
VSSNHEINLRDMAVRILNTRFFSGDGRIRSFSTAGVEITTFPIAKGRGLTINHRTPDTRPRSVFVVHTRSNEPAKTLLYVAGSWEECIVQLAAEARPRKLEAVR